MWAIEIIVPFFIAGIGTCFSGIILDHVQFWEVFKNVEETVIVLPAILGLKGNLQMTLASRFSTHSHLGHIETKQELMELSFANLALNQCFSIIVSILASILALSIQAEFLMPHVLLVMATSLLTSSITSFVLDVLMILVVQTSAMYGINPDNVATPFASSLGDLLALLLSAYLSSSFYSVMDKHVGFYYISASVIVFYFLILPFLANVAQSNDHTYKILNERSHWFALIVAMVISTMSGTIIQDAVIRYQHIALFTPVICGVGGNLVGVQASRLSSLLHQTSTLGELPENRHICENPFTLFLSNLPGSSTTRLLLGIVLPGQVIFLYFCLHVNFLSKKPPTEFYILYLTATQAQVAILIYVAHVLIYALWTIGVDPDNAAIPYLTSISDILGAFLITATCMIVLPINST